MMQCKHLNGDERGGGNYRWIPWGWRPPPPQDVAISQERVRILCCPVSSRLHLLFFSVILPSFLKIYWGFSMYSSSPRQISSWNTCWLKTRQRSPSSAQVESYESSSLSSLYSSFPHALGVTIYIYALLILSCLPPILFTLCHGWHLPLTQFRIQTALTPKGWLKGCSSVALAQSSCSHFSLSADMLKDIIQEYDEYFPEIIEWASYALEKLKGQPWGNECNDKALNQTKAYVSLLAGPQRHSNPAPSLCRWADGSLGRLIE